jgi:dTDP-4-dehydrorhamnose 3,5-epimerase
MKLIETSIADVKILEPRVFDDERGCFFETWNQREFDNLGLSCAFLQDNHSRSSRGVLRGLHYQILNPQGKLVRVVSGAVIDVAVDLRRSSVTFGQHVAVELSAESKRMLWVPPGFAHGFYVTSEGADLLYKCTNIYSPQHEQTLLWSDPALGIDWQVERAEFPILSAKDKLGVPLALAATFA